MKKSDVDLHRFAQIMAHEVRNPLAGIRANAQLLRSALPADPANTAYHDSLDLIISEIDRIKQLIDEFMSFAKPAPPKKEQIDVALVLRDMERLVIPDAEALNVEVVVKGCSESLIIEGDEGHCRRLLLNLIMNSLQSMESGGRLTLEAGQGAEGAVIIVEDTGCGIAERDRERIFDPFVTTKTAGLGLGLCVCRSIVESHGWFMDIHSVEGQGTRVQIAIPRGG